MCEHCGCQKFIEEGKEAIRQRVIDIIKELDLTPANVDDYEATEAITGLIFPFAGKEEDEVYQTASWVSKLHESRRLANRDERYQAYVHAFRDIFTRLPVQDAPKHIATIYHQLEQLARELDEITLASVDPEIRQAIQAVNHVHDDTTRTARLKARYQL